MAFQIVVIGTSLGGLSALAALLKPFPLNYRLPIVVVQHRSVESGELLLRELRRHITLPISEPSDRDRLQPGHLYIAPADYHLLIEPGELRLSTEGPVSYARPSIDVLFESAVDAYGPATVGVILTGANADGAQGALRVKQLGGTVVVQDPEEAECPVMPRAALKMTQVDSVLNLSEIRRYLIGLCADTGER